MTRTVLHSFDPPADSPVTGATVDPTVADIEGAGIREVLQIPGTAYGAWSIPDALPTPTGAGTSFIFKEPLGQAREVKVALPDSFGRFAARAYLERSMPPCSLFPTPHHSRDRRTGFRICRPEMGLLREVTE